MLSFVAVGSILSFGWEKIGRGHPWEDEEEMRGRAYFGGGRRGESSPYSRAMTPPNTTPPSGVPPPVGGRKSMHCTTQAGTATWLGVCSTLRSADPALGAMEVIDKANNLGFARRSSSLR